MSSESSKGLNFWGQQKKKLQNTYRFIVMNNETFEEVASHRISLLNIWILVSTVIVLVAAIVVSAIVFTPLKRYLPGYNYSDAQTVLALNRQVEKLEKELQQQKLYTENVQKVLIGDFQTADELKEQSQMLEEELGTDIKPAEQIEIDKRLRDEVDFQKPESQAPPIEEPEIEEPQIQDLEEAKLNLSPKNVSMEQIFFSPPVSGPISSGFMPNLGHNGVDILAPKNTAVKAALDGYIFFSDWTLETGNTIGIQHENNIISFYKHNSVLLKKVGSFVKAGEAVAIIGNTGTLSNGPHLHFELWNNGEPVDPTEYISF